jgi:hypothetical protein
MLRIVTALALVIALPGSASAGPIKEAVEEAARKLAQQTQEQKPGKGQRFWTGVTLLAGGGVMTALGALELGDDETGPDDGEDSDDSDDGEDSDGWGNKALMGSGIAAAAVGGFLLFTGRKSSPSISIGRGRLTVRHTLRF